MKVGPERARGLSTVWPALAGAAQAASIAMPGSGQAQGWLQVLSLAALAAGLVSLARHTPSVRAPYRQAAWSGGVFATTWLAGSFWWLYVSMHDVGGLPAPLAALAVCALAGALALYYAAASAAWLVLARGALVQKPGAVSVLFAALWTLAELMRGRWLTGFPWGAGGYAHVDGVLSVWAPWVGVYGMGALAAWLAMRLALSGWRLRALKPLLGLGLVSWGLQAWGPSFTTSAGVGQVALLQANISQSAKFDAASGIRDALQWYEAQLRANQQPLVVAPETAIPLLPRHLPEGYWSGLQAHFAQPGRPVALVGVPLGSLDQGYSNSVVALGPQGAAPYRYDKSHLVPFGEFIPPGFAWFIRMMKIPLGDFKSGACGPARHRLARPAPGTQRLLRRPVWRRAGHSFQEPPASPDSLGQCEQHRLVWRHAGGGPASEHLSHAGHGVGPPHAAGHQHRGHGHHRPPGARDAPVAPFHPGQPDRLV